jgi:predicted small secreted protein
MKKIALISIVATSVVLFTGCATLFGGGGKQNISVITNSTKQMTIGHTEDNKTLIQPQTFTSPTVVTVLRERQDLLIKDEKGECEPVVVESKMNPWVWGDIIPLSLLSTTVDLVTGAAWKYDDNVTLKCKN